MHQCTTKTPLLEPSLIPPTVQTPFRNAARDAGLLMLGEIQRQRKLVGDR